MTVTIDDLCNGILKRAGGASRFLVGVAGPPGAGKSTLADAVAAHLTALGEAAEVLPMDGFHMDNAVLEEKGILPRKGAPESFDVRGFTDILRAARLGEQEILVPVFDRSRELAIAAARAIPSACRFVVVEGNYLLLQQDRWKELRPLFDYAIALAPPVEELEKRLTARWHHYGLSGDALETKLHGNDLPNVRLVLSQSAGADLVLTNWTVDD
ncbi:nucleoside triphosphate hydrolase [Neorhizobium lilium]|uniref:Nucleoside triphosphate hydrolase n=1 Tax=Neorhizobium lilium TaxID=2503024 RepID=A0A444LI13_9HYPH|nr:nucleoside triphosphate hydrolase [Neorhizobium lilium]RWX78554.1 nucleoside triphosphate hydrolase [Neorhizobium lilium]